jgi:2,4-dienoyl-CoA reductase-like NADH-dependent reductase (Old Yellow Enzyme family)
LYGAYQGQQAAQQNQEQAAKNQAEIKALADPYRTQAAQFQQQGQQLINLGQGGGLTSPQQKRLEVQRAQAAQQLASAGVSGGTSQQQLEANLQQQAAAFAQQNIDEVLDNGMDAVAIARALIRNPNFINELKKDASFKVSCDTCNHCMAVMYNGPFECNKTGGYHG